MKAFGVRDIKSASFVHQFFDKSTPAACRGFDVVVNEKASQFGNFPDDFELFELGSLDLDTGLLSPLAAPVSLGLARNFVRASDQPLARARQ